jgi:RNA polymerase sigma factor (sigma-70 family)
VTQDRIPDDPNDADLLEAYRAGDSSALAVLFERYRNALYAYIARMTEGRGDADEIFQETWFRAIRHLPRFRDGHFRAWLYRICHNLMIDRGRDESRWTSLDQPCTGTEGEPAQDRLAATGPDPAALAAGHDLGRMIDALLAGLPAAQREVFLLRTEGDLPFREIARLQGVSINTALARMQYAVEKLRAGLKAEAPFEEYPS